MEAAVPRGLRAFVAATRQVDRVLFLVTCSLVVLIPLLLLDPNYPWRAEIQRTIHASTSYKYPICEMVESYTTYSTKNRTYVYNCRDFVPFPDGNGYVSSFAPLAGKEPFTWTVWHIATRNALVIRACNWFTGSCVDDVTAHETRFFLRRTHEGEERAEDFEVHHGVTFPVARAETPSPYSDGVVWMTMEFHDIDHGLERGKCDERSCVPMNTKWTVNRIGYFATIERMQVRRVNFRLSMTVCSGVHGCEWQSSRFLYN